MTTHKERLASIDVFQRIRRALTALRSRINVEHTVDVLWPVWQVKALDVDSDCGVTKHVWSEERLFQDDLVARGCLRCSAVQRVPPAPNPADRDAVERWLDS